MRRWERAWSAEPEDCLRRIPGWKCMRAIRGREKDAGTMLHVTGCVTSLVALMLNKDYTNSLT